VSSLVLAGAFASPWVRVPIVIVLALALQTGVLADVRVFGIAPDIMLLLAIASGLAVGPERGAIMGAIIGFSFDLVLQTPLGLSALVYGFAAMVVGLLSTGTIKSTRWIPVVATMATSAAAVLVYALIGGVLGIERAIALRLVPMVFVVSVVNGLLALPALAVMRWALQADERRI
jgi:rod shape-determining protein MreD